MKYLSVLILFFGQLHIVHAQKFDHIWLMGSFGGNQTPPNDEWGCAILDFNYPNKPALFNKQEYDMNFDNTDASICDSLGNLLFYTNGEKVYNRTHKLMENGNGISPSSDGLGSRLPQGAIILPYPGETKKYIIFSTESPPDGSTYGWKFLYHVVDLNYNNGLGKLIAKRQLLLQDTLFWGKITAVKHSNGRDWWVLIPYDKEDRYCIILLSPSGPKIIENSYLGNISFDGFGQSIFTPNGKYYIRTDNVSINGPTYISIYEFDRCSGQIGNVRIDSLFSPDFAFGAGASVSYDSRYLYVFHSNIAAQYDLTASDIFASKKIIGLYDGFISGFKANRFLFSQLGPDGRIYVASLVNTFHWHVVDFPHRDGLDCSFRQHAIEFPVDLSYSIPNLPNYRLGPLDGSPCDTLGIDNHPLANYRWEQEDSTDILQVTFTDLSSYEPDSWTWDFGDGTGSTERYPVHQYDTAGIYEACLIVKNEYSADTFCQVLVLGVPSGTEETASGEEGISISPNPFGETFSVFVPPAFGPCEMRLYDQLGREVLNRPLSPGSNKIEAEGLEPGLYFYRVEMGGKAYVSGKLCRG